MEQEYKKFSRIAGTVFILGGFFSTIFLGAEGLLLSGIGLPILFAPEINDNYKNVEKDRLERIRLRDEKERQHQEYLRQQEYARQQQAYAQQQAVQPVQNSQPPVAQDPTVQQFMVDQNNFNNKILDITEKHHNTLKVHHEKHHETDKRLTDIEKFNKEQEKIRQEQAKRLKNLEDKLSDFDDDDDSPYSK